MDGDVSESSLEDLVEYESSVSSASFVSDGVLATDEEVSADLVERPDVSVASVTLGTNPVYAITISAYNREGNLCLVAAGTGDDSVVILAISVKDGKPELKPLQEISDFPDTVSAVKFSPDSQFLAVCSYAKKEEGTIVSPAQVRIYRMNGSAINCQVAVLIDTLQGPNDDVEWVCWSSALECAVGTREGKVWIYGLYNNEFICMSTLTGHQRRVTCGVYHSSPQLEGHLITGGKDGKLCVWLANRGKAVLTLEPSAKWQRHRINAIACHPTEPLIATAGNDNSVRIVNVKSGCEDFAIRIHKDSVESVAFNNDRLLVTAGLDGLVSIVDIRTKSVIRRFYHDPGTGVISAFFTPDNRIVSCGTDGTTRVWSLHEDKSIILSGHSNVVSCAEILLFGNYLVSGSFDSTLKLFVF